MGYIAQIFRLYFRLSTTRGARSIYPHLLLGRSQRDLSLHCRLVVWVRGLDAAAMSFLGATSVLAFAVRVFVSTITCIIPRAQTLPEYRTKIGWGSMY